MLNIKFNQCLPLIHQQMAQKRYMKTLKMGKNVRCVTHKYSSMFYYRRWLAIHISSSESTRFVKYNHEVSSTSSQLNYVTWTEIYISREGSNTELSYYLEHFHYLHYILECPITKPTSESTSVDTCTSPSTEGSNVT